MAIIYKCDRCHTASSDSHFLTKVNVEYDGEYPCDSIIIKSEICISCLRALKEWIKPQLIMEKAVYK